MKAARPLALLLASLIVTLIGLAGLVAVVVHSSQELARTDDLIVGDSIPSIVALEAATMHLGELQALLHDRIRGDGDHALIDVDIAEKRAALRESMRQYFELPVDPGEAEVHAELRAEIPALDRVIGRILDAPPGRAAPAELAAAVDQAATRVDNTLVQAVNINTDVAQRAITSLQGVRRTFFPGVIVLQGVCLAGAAAALGLAYRAACDAEKRAIVTRRLLEDKTDELEAFTGRVAHDLMSPLAVVGLALAAAEPRLPPGDDDVRRTLARAGRNLQHVQRMTMDLLEFARAGARPVPGAETDAARVVQEVADDLAPLAGDARAELVLEVSTRRRVRCTAGVLGSVLANLVQNAVKYLDDVPVRRVTVRAADDGAFVRFEVEDTGAGIPADAHDEIFEPYVRRHDGVPGLGLGLATVKRFAEACGGRVGVRSEMGRGALFWVTIPAEQPR
jgi:signal transduction histidine kinase